MKIREFIARLELGEARPFRIAFKPPSDPLANSFSLLVGANGTRKSRTLRDLVIITVPNISKEAERIDRKAGSVHFWSSAGVAQVIAVSGVATDRFPSRLASRRHKNYQLNYSYIGPRSDNNLVSRAQAIHQTAIALLADTGSLREKSRQLRAAFAPLNFAPAISFDLGKVSVPSIALWTHEDLKSYINTSRAARLALDVHDDVFERAVRFLNNRKRAAFRLDLDASNVMDTRRDKPEVMHFLLMAGLLRVDTCHCATAAGKQFELGGLSSGQWHILSSLLFVAATVSNDTLLLVDEPENSLHPAWQQEYLPLLKQAVSSATGVHVIVSTHSPHVASSLPPTNAEVLVLNQGRTRVTCSPLHAGPYGWTSDDILRVAFKLKTTRSRGFSRKMDAALRLFAKGDRRNPKLIEKVGELEMISASLPDEDAAKEIIRTMASLVAAKAKDGRHGAD